VTESAEDSTDRPFVAADGHKCSSEHRDTNRTADRSVVQTSGMKVGSGVDVLRQRGACGNQTGEGGNIPEYTAARAAHLTV
jgi:hypothetical protein